MKKDFYLEIVTYHKPWPFSWGPFGGRERRTSLCERADISIQIDEVDLQIRAVSGEKGLQVTATKSNVNTTTLVSPNERS